jgi:hypothetical protein
VVQDLFNIIETVENLYLHIIDMNEQVQLCKDSRISDEILKKLSPTQASETLLDTLKQLYPPVIRRILRYTPPSASFYTANNVEKRGAMHGDDAEIARVSREIAEYVNETNPGAVKLCRDFVRLRGPEEAWALAREAEGKVARNLTHRSVAGAFIELCKMRTDAKRQANAGRLTQALKQECVPWSPRRYQIEMHDLASRGNAIVVLPTGTGKTKIAALYLNHLWRGKPGAKCVFIAQEVSLVLQQTCALLQSCVEFDHPAGVKGPRASAFGSFNSVPPISWERLVTDLDLLVFTPQTLINFLRREQNRHICGWCVVLYRTEQTHLWLVRCVV